jgi:chemotaxis protein MotA
MISQSRHAVLSLLRALPHKLSEPSEDAHAVLSALLKLAECYRHGDIRGAEAVVKGLPASFVRIGLYLVIDLHGRDHLMRIMQWHIGKKRDELEREVLILRTMGSYAPAFGMLGTLCGLIHMLYGLGDSRLDSLGGSMGFAMMTTVYGLIAAALIFKPLAVKLERHVKLKLTWMYTQYEAVLMIYERQPPRLIREYLDTFLEDREAERRDMPTMSWR